MPISYFEQQNQNTGLNVQNLQYLPTDIVDTDELIIIRNGQAYRNTAQNIKLYTNDQPQANPDPNNEDPYFSNIVLFLKGNGNNGSTNIVDSSPNPKTITVNGNAQISTAQSKYNGSSILLNADGDFLTLPATNNGDLLFGTRDFTIETWIYPISKISTYPTIIGNFTTYENNAWSIIWEDLQNSNKPAFIVRNNGDLPRFLLLNITPTYGSWRHIAVCRNGNIFRFFIDGILQGSVTSSISVNSSKDTIRIGKADAPTQFRGYISHARITMDVGRYTDNFNPETDTYLI